MLDAEKLKFLFVVACSTDIDKDGYHTDVGTAKALMRNSEIFQVSILNDKGQVLLQSHRILSAKKITQLILNFKNK